MQLADVKRMVVGDRQAVRATLNGVVVWELPSPETVFHTPLRLSHFDELDASNEGRLLLSGDAQSGAAFLTF